MTSYGTIAYYRHQSSDSRLHTPFQTSDPWCSQRFAPWHGLHDCNHSTQQAWYEWMNTLQRNRHFEPKVERLIRGKLVLHVRIAAKTLSGQVGLSAMSECRTLAYVRRPARANVWSQAWLPSTRKSSALSSQLSRRHISLSLYLSLSLSLSLSLYIYIYTHVCICIYVISYMQNIVNRVAVTTSLEPAHICWVVTLGHRQIRISQTWDAADELREPSTHTCLQIQC